MAERKDVLCIIKRVLKGMFYTGYWIIHDYIYGPVHTKEFFIENGIIQGPFNSGVFSIKEGVILGPGLDGEYFVDEDGRIYGPDCEVPWLKKST